MFKNLKKQIEEGSGGNPIPPQKASVNNPENSDHGKLIDKDSSSQQNSTTTTKRSTGFIQFSPNENVLITTLAPDDMASPGKPHQTEPKPNPFPKSNTNLHSQSLPKIPDSSVTKSALHKPTFHTSADQNSFSTGHSSVEFSELRARHENLEKAYEGYRVKTGELLGKKDTHISRLQERVASLEEKLLTLQQGEKLHSVVTDRDLLRKKLQELESAYSTEKTEWEAKTKDLQKQLSTLSAQYNTQINQLLDADRLKSEEAAKLHTKLSELDQIKIHLEESVRVKSEEIQALDFEIQQVKVDNSTLAIERDELANKLKEFLMRSDDEQKDVVEQNDKLRVALDQQQEYFENLDIDSENQITTLANEVEDLHTALDNQCRDLNALSQKLAEKEQESEALQAKMLSFDTNMTRQQDVVEGLREEIDKQKEEVKDVTKDRDDLLLRNASLSHEVEVIKRQSGNQLEEIQLQLKEVSRESEICRAKIREQEADQDSAAKIEELENKISELDTAVTDRDTTIRLQQQRLSDMKKTLQKELKTTGNVSRTGSNVSNLGSMGQISAPQLRQQNFMMSSNPNLSFSSPHDSEDEFQGAFGVNFQYMKHVMLRFITASDYEAAQLVRAVTTLLKLSTAEEQLIWDTLRWKQSWVPTAKPRLT